jgi:hypothetical protein
LGRSLNEGNSLTSIIREKRINMSLTEKRFLSQIPPLGSEEHKGVPIAWVPLIYF